MILPDLIHQDDLNNKLSDYRYFSDEQHRRIDIDKFISIFVYKYGGLLSDWSMWIQYGKKNDELHLMNISGFKYVFPLIKN
jgi:hypothetical protein